MKKAKSYGLKIYHEQEWEIFKEYAKSIELPVNTIFNNFVVAIAKQYEDTLKMIAIMDERKTGKQDPEPEPVVKAPPPPLDDEDFDDSDDGSNLGLAD